MSPVVVAALVVPYVLAVAHVMLSSVLLFRSDSSVNIGGEIYPGSPRWCVGKSRLPGGIRNLILFSS